MEQLPICLDIKGRSIVVAGDGPVAARKALLARSAGGAVTVYSTDPCDELRRLADGGRIVVRERKPDSRDMAGAAMVFAAAEDDVRDAEVGKLAREAGVLVSVEDHVELSDFTMPSIIDRSPLVIAVSSAGVSPLLGRLIRQRLEATVPAAFGNLTRFLGSIRETLAKRIPDVRKRRRFVETVVDGTVADLVLANDEPRARRQLEQSLEAFVKDEKSAQGEVYLVGGGPGDPDLLTFRALRLMQRADVVVYDRLVGSPILDLVRSDAERVYVGKRRNDHALPQEDISKLLVTLARQGKRVLRLKGGDPFIFGRGGEEIELLAAEGIPFQIVPGITAASGCASFAGIPLTHRDHAQSCVFLTGHTKTGRLSADWATVMQPGQTVVIYMGLAFLADLMRDFLAHGADPALPVAVIENGTRPNQKVVTGTVSSIAGVVSEAGITGNSPALTIIGSVVTLRDKLAWFNEAEPPKVAATAAFSAEVGQH
ncbi:MAG: siroheme synthase CysG [Hyphomicrobiaceae bacterium]